MSKDSRKGRIAFLLMRRFPFHPPAYEYESPIPETSTPKSIKIAERRRNLFPLGVKTDDFLHQRDDLASVEFEAAVREYENLDDDSIWNLSTIEGNKVRAEYDETVWFNRSVYRPEYAHWAQMSHWTIDEAIALSLNRDPRKLTVAAAEEERGNSPTAQKFFRRKVIAERAITNGQLPRSPTKTQFIAWAERLRWEIPSELKEAVEELGDVVEDWHALYQMARSAKEEASLQVESLRKELDDAKVKISELEILAADAVTSEVDSNVQSQSIDDLDPREMSNIYLVIHGLASSNPYSWQSRKGAGYDKIRSAIDDVTDGKLVKPGSRQCIGNDTLLKMLRNAADAVEKRIQDIHGG